MYYLVSIFPDIKRIITEEDPFIKTIFENSPKCQNVEEVIKAYWDIQNKSENIAELLEKGDQVIFNGISTKVIDKKSVFFNTYIVFKIDQNNFYNVKILNNKISRIAKPNSKGDYIIVWERKK